METCDRLAGCGELAEAGPPRRISRATALPSPRSAHPRH